MSYPNSLYAATANQGIGSEPFSGEAHYDVAVVGGGFTGTSTALHLAQRGFKVVLLEAGKIGWGASGRNGGQLGSAQVVLQPDLAKRYGPDKARLLWEIADSGKNLVKSLISEHNIDCQYKAGHLGCAVKQGDLDWLSDHAEYVDKHYGYNSYSLQDKAAVSNIAKHDIYVGGLLDSSAGHLHPLNFVLGLAQAAMAAGVTIHENTRVTDIKNGTPAKVCTEDGTITADFVVMGCNGYLDRLAPKIASQILPADCYQIATAPLSEEIQSTILSDEACLYDTFREVYYYRKTQDGRLIFGGGVGHPGKVPNDIPKVVRHHLTNIYPQLADVKIDYSWTGTFANTLSQIPSFGRLAPNVLYAHGYSGHGIALGTMAGKILAECIAGQAEQFDLMSSIPQRRFPGAGLCNTPILSLGVMYVKILDKLGM